jgi:hypothetical protein
MDSDDFSYPDRLERQLDFLSSHPDVAIVGGGIKIVDEDGHFLALRRCAPDHRAIVRRFALINAMCHPTIMWDRDKVGWNIRYDERRTHAEDLELWLRLLSQGHHFANLEASLIEYKQTNSWRRKPENWRHNLAARATNWRLVFRHPSQLVGLLAFSILSVAPRPAVDFLTQRNRFSDYVRSIHPSGNHISVP